LKAAFLTTRLEKPSARYRFLQYLPHLKAAGHEAEVFTLPEGFFKRRALFKRFSEFDVVFLQKRLLGAIEWRVLRKHARRIVYDFDDAVMFDDSKKKAAPSIRRLSRFKRTVYGSDVVIAGNKYLADWARKYREDIVIIPTPVDTDAYRKISAKKDSGHVTLGWIGSRATIGYLKDIEDALSSLHAERPYVRLKIVADEFPDIKGIPVIEKDWSAEDEISDIKSFDIGLMPLLDDAWTRGKCGFKLLQYMAAGVASVASPVGVNKEIINDGVNGFLAKDNAEFVKKVSSLIEERGLSKALSDNALKTVEEGYSLKYTAPLFVDALEKAAE